MASRKVADFYARRARELGYAARSAFKLLEMHEKKERAKSKTF